MVKKGKEQAGNSSYQAQSAAQAERTIRALLQTLDLPLRGFYSSNQVCSIFGFSSHTFCLLINKFETDDHGRPVAPNCLRALQLGLHHRVAFLELVEFVKRNDDFQRSASKNPQNADHIATDKTIAERVAIYKTKNAMQAERSIKAALLVCNLPIKASYTQPEVSLILGISMGSFWLLVKKFELDGKCLMVRPDCLRPTCKGRAQISFSELVDFVKRNDKHLRSISHDELLTGEQNDTEL